MDAKLDMDHIAKALGAERRGKVSASGGYFGAPSVHEGGPFKYAPAAAFEEEWREINNQLIDMGCLHDDWDGEGSVAPDRGVVAGAIRLASALQTKSTPAADRVTAGVNGTVCFEWHNAEGYQEIEVTSPIDAEFRRMQKGATTADVIRIKIR